MQYYHNIITEKSFKFLQELRKKYDFILIGGWAVFFYARALKSKDIDIIIDYEELAKLKENYDIFKNERLKKYEIKAGEFDIDIYLPHYSDLGIDISKIKDFAFVKDGFVVPQIEILLMLKLFAWQKRRGSIKGQKDEIDIFSLIVLPEFDWSRYLALVDDFNFKNFHKNLVDLVKRTHRVKELKINEKKMAEFRKRILPKIES